ncbi:PREDICTED: uncharacterized protein LOC105965951 [Erythranthe guttata]|uniref:uncharacterized protein LOC105965951 n=1 Tax=Erythranthe guttata TaxID=4155 RepID=UPI00064DC1DD|nr:PREDICTED: uncharacterized protein LOC105965951 [Erythranthe guttata]|eukprot:XP_012845950.1 PREDICTED: uncharacterized protein LOC105965951 [Erythranthe guttata]
METFSSMGKITVGRVYDWIRAPSGGPPWGRRIWDHSMTPKHSFILWLAALDRLQTLENVAKFEAVEKTCEMCGAGNEDREHLFFRCSVSRDVWDRIRVWLGISQRPTTLRAALKWLVKDVKGKSYRSKTRRCALASVVYHIWAARNKRKFDMTEMTATAITRRIQTHVYSAMFMQYPELTTSSTRN